MEYPISFNKGDKVRIKSRQWYLENRDYNGFVNFHRGDDFAFSPYTAKYCGYIFEIACKIGSTKGGNNVYLLKYADGYFTEDMFDAVPNNAPLTINSKNVFAVKDIIEKDNKWFEAELLPVAPTNAVKTSPFFRRYKEIDFFAFEWIKATLENKYKNYKPIGLLRPFTIPDSKLEISDVGGTIQCFQRDYLRIPDYALSKGGDIMALYIVV